MHLILVSAQYYRCTMYCTSMHCCFYRIIDVLCSAQCAQCARYICIAILFYCFSIQHYFCTVYSTSVQLYCCTA